MTKKTLLAIAITLSLVLHSGIGFLLLYNKTSDTGALVLNPIIDISLVPGGAGIPRNEDGTGFSYGSSDSHPSHIDTETTPQQNTTRTEVSRVTPLPSATPSLKTAASLRVKNKPISKVKKNNFSKKTQKIKPKKAVSQRPMRATRKKSTQANNATVKSVPRQSLNALSSNNTSVGSAGSSGSGPAGQAVKSHTLALGNGHSVGSTAGNGSGHSGAHVLKRVTPDYPAKAKKRRIEGKVIVAFTVTPTGTVENARVITAKPQGIFDHSALHAIIRWKFRPAFQNGRPVAVELRLPIVFQLR
ncbi:energy transducer TonB [Desulfovibrio inopinatus]|uniref:energy transducer TonB n=1 Tax=Desulfovibrio inopinatus TaxID=102109 RepID=UPI00146FA5B1|nr:energy transducer TonB [Desulfovibrio inopinatus]